MKYLSKTSIYAVVFTLLALVTLAEEQQQQQPSSKIPISIASGTVTKIDIEKKTFEIKTAKDKILVFFAGEKTKFTKSDKEIGFADLAVKNYLVITYKNNDDGRLIAKRVFVNEKSPEPEQTTPPSAPVPAPDEQSAPGKDNK